MGFLVTMAGIVKNLMRSLSTGEMEGPLERLRARVSGSIKSVLKGLLMEFFMLIVIFTIVIMGVSEIFNIFSDIFSLNISHIDDVEIEDVREWANGLTDREVRDMLNQGASIHPKKIPLYLGIEDASYPKNINIRVPVETNYNGDKSISYTSYEYRIGDAAYPYRLWWQSMASLDAINDTSTVLKNTKIIDRAEKELTPVYEWGDGNIPNYKNGERYDWTSKYEEVTTVTVTTYDEIILGGGRREKINYSKEIIKTYRPLPYLDSVDTMFGVHSFKYESSVEEDDPIVTKGSSWIYVDGDDSYTAIPYKIYEKKVDSWLLQNTEHNYHEAFSEFLDKNNIDNMDDPQVMYYMAGELPQSGDFIAEFKGYLDFMEGEQEYAYFDGDFGDYTGGVMYWPVPGYSRISSYYGYRIHPIFKKRQLHTGIDIPANRGQTVIAAKEGTVVFSGTKGGYGSTVIVNHGGEISTLYAHNSRLLVKRGDVVEKGQAIARVGNTGNSTGPHLHFEVRKNNVAVDPLPWLR